MAPNQGARKIGPSVEGVGLARPGPVRKSLRPFAHRGDCTPLFLHLAKPMTRCWMEKLSRARVEAGRRRWRLQWWQRSLRALCPLFVLLLCLNLSVSSAGAIFSGACAGPPAASQLVSSRCPLLLHLLLILLLLRLPFFSATKWGCMSCLKLDE